MEFSTASRPIIIKEIWLTGKRRQIATLIVEGYQEKEIAKKIYLSLSSVKKHIFILKDKIGCQTLQGLSAYLGMLLVFNGHIKIELKNGTYTIIKNHPLSKSIL